MWVVGLWLVIDFLLLLECVKKVESFGKEFIYDLELKDDFDLEFVGNNGVFSEFWIIVGMLIEVFLSNFVLVYGISFCEVFGCIVFVLVERGMLSIGGFSGGRKVLVVYNEVVFVKDWFLVWICVLIFVRFNVVFFEFFWGVFCL